MALNSQLLAKIIILLVTRLFSLFKLVCLFGIKTALLFVYTWTEWVKTTIIFNINIILGIVKWTFGLISLPARIMNAFHRERQLEQKLHKMQKDLENLVWDYNVLQEHFQMAVKERKMMKLLVEELEEEHHMAIAKIEKLEGKLRDQINENCRLGEVHGKAYWSSKDQNKTDNFLNIDNSSNNILHSVMQWNSTCSGSTGISLQDLLTLKDIWDNDDSKTRTDLLKLLKTGPNSMPVPQVKPEMISKEVGLSQVLDHRREVAVSQSLFSTILSLLVGVTVWQSEDPCMPLVVALFTVVSMSLKSVMQFFSTIKNKPASDAVALLSFNWFILGTLTYPTLPRVTCVMAPIMSRLMDTMSQFGLLTLASQ